MVPEALLEGPLTLPLPLPIVLPLGAELLEVLPGKYVLLLAGDEALGPPAVLVFCSSSLSLLLMSASCCLI
jgi:hypothetical protein